MQKKIFVLAPFLVFLLGTDIGESLRCEIGTGLPSEVQPATGGPQLTPPPDAVYDYNAATVCSGAGALATWTDDGSQGNNLTASGDPQCLLEGADGASWVVDFDGVGDYFTSAGAYTLTQPSTQCAIFRMDTLGTQRVYDGNSASGRNILYYASGLTAYAVAAGITHSEAASTATYAFVCALYNGASSRFRFQGVTDTGTVGSHSRIGVYLGTDQGRASELNGTIQRHMAWSGDVFDDAVTCLETSGCMVDL